MRKRSTEKCSTWNFDLSSNLWLCIPVNRANCAQVSIKAWFRIDFDAFCIVKTSCNVRHVRGLYALESGALVAIWLYSN